MISANGAASDAGIIDVWNIDTFDIELRGDLDAHADLIRDYMITSRRQSREHEASDHKTPYPENPHAGEFLALNEHIMRLMEARTIRAWHYTRMTDAEIDAVREKGIYPSSLDNIRSRFDAQVVAGAFSQEVADRLFADSPYQRQFEARAGMFWMTSHPIDIEYDGVAVFLESWGGEAAHFCQEDEAIRDTLKQIGRPRVLEIAMPLSHSRRSYSAAEAVVATYGRTLGCQPDKQDFDLYSEQPLSPAHILAVHSEGEPAFSAIARGYPVQFVDVNLGRWGEE
ncbi:hypothetical protein PANO111632_03530 [Paracoccus nototheniae]|uniref:Uncharacterized protein n=1 Tax=Paracoccus nototheniae TaxID=2489002 RepID=A0ABW4DR79_9RHOB|nr:hypothetical protein [Paracoccus nototheniae]